MLPASEWFLRDIEYSMDTVVRKFERLRDAKLPKKEAEAQEAQLGIEIQQAREKTGCREALKAAFGMPEPSWARHGGPAPGIARSAFEGLEGLGHKDEVMRDCAIMAVRQHLPSALVWLSAHGIPADPQIWIKLREHGESGSSEAAPLGVLCARSFSARCFETLDALGLLGAEREHVSNPGFLGYPPLIGMGRRFSMNPEPERALSPGRIAALWRPEREGELLASVGMLAQSHPLCLAMRAAPHTREKAQKEMLDTLINRGFGGRSDELMGLALMSSVIESPSVEGFKRLKDMKIHPKRLGPGQAMDLVSMLLELRPEARGANEKILRAAQGWIQGVGLIERLSGSADDLSVAMGEVMRQGLSRQISGKRYEKAFIDQVSQGLSGEMLGIPGLGLPSSMVAPLRELLVAGLAGRDPRRDSANGIEHAHELMALLDASSPLVSRPAPRV